MSDYNWKAGELRRKTVMAECTNRRFGTNHKPEDITDYDIDDERVFVSRKDGHSWFPLDYFYEVYDELYPRSDEILI